MNWKMMIIMCMVIGLLLVGCQSNQPPTGYYSYQGGAAQPQGGQYVGGGCGLSAANGDTISVNSVAPSA